MSVGDPTMIRGTGSSSPPWPGSCLARAGAPRGSAGRAGPPLADLARRLETFCRLGWRHPDVRQHDIGPQHADELQQPLRVPGAGHLQPASPSKRLRPSRSSTASSAMTTRSGAAADTVTGMGSRPGAGYRRPWRYRSARYPPRTRPGRPARAGPTPSPAARRPARHPRFPQRSVRPTAAPPPGGAGGWRVFGHVGDCLGDHEVGGGLDRRREPAGWHRADRRSHW
jgi:hypothetical protein